MQLAFSLPSQPRRKRRESMALYEAVLLLRRSGYRVSRSGRTMHIVDGKRVPPTILKEMAALYRGASA